MFKFDFQADDDDSALPPPKPSSSKIDQLEPFAELALPQLLESLPSMISYSPLSIPLSSGGKTVTLARRDLFDARFQLISDSSEPEDEHTEPVAGAASALAFLDAPSDLVPGVYEGGLKTWECSLDLVNYLDGLAGMSSSYFSGKRILEVGCGTGIPSVYLLHRFLSGDVDSNAANTYLHLQDYNASVLELITFPNIVLAWYMSPASTEYRDAVQSQESPEVETDQIQTTPADPTAPGELHITPALKDAFSASLTKHKIVLSFSSGPWEALTSHLRSRSPFDDNPQSGHAYDIVLTSETIYRVDALPALIELLHQACAGGGAQFVCLVAAKVLYFGVGGGVSEFASALESHTMVERRCAGKAETVWERNVGVGRKILRIEWV